MPSWPKVYLEGFEEEKDRFSDLSFPNYCLMIEKITGKTAESTSKTVSYDIFTRNSNSTFKLSESISIFFPFFDLSA